MADVYKRKIARDNNPEPAALLEALTDRATQAAY